METLRAAVKQRLSAAAEDIFRLFERTIAEFEAEMIRQLKPELNAPGPGLFIVTPLLSADVREEQEGPQHRHIKEEEEEVWPNQEAAAVCDVTAVTVKIEEEEENPKSCHPYGRSQSEENREEPVRTSAPLLLHRAPETHVCADWTMHTGNESHGHGGKLYRCLECGNEFSQSSNLKTHMKIHTGEKAFCCSLCDKSFVQKIHLLQHMSTHTGEKMFSCSVCHKRFTLHYQLRKHLRLCTGSSSSSSSSHFLTQEVLGGVVIDEGRGRKKQVICPECGDAFGSKDSLRRHFRTHTGEKPFGCPICGRHFRDRGNMGKHMVIHTGEKRFSCDVCGRRFTWKVQLKKHKCDGGGGAQ